MADEVGFHTAAGFGHRTREPFVSIALGETMTQVSPAKARQLAGMLLECAEAAEGDALIMTFATRKLGMTEQQSGQLLLLFRDERRKREARDAPKLEPIEPEGEG